MWQPLRGTLMSGVDSLYGTNEDLLHLTARKGINVNEGTSNILCLTRSSNICELTVIYGALLYRIASAAKCNFRSIVFFDAIKRVVHATTLVACSPK